MRENALVALAIVALLAAGLLVTPAPEGSLLGAFTRNLQAQGRLASVMTFQLLQAEEKK